jgi:hypothetical protein
MMRPLFFKIPGGATLSTNPYMLTVTAVSATEGVIDLEGIARVSFGATDAIGGLSTAVIQLQVSLDREEWENLGTAVSSSDLHVVGVDVENWPFARLAVTAAYGAAPQPVPVWIWGVPYEDVN